MVLLDIMMPKLSGFEVCQRLRADPATARVGVLMVTALDQPTDIERAVEVGTDDFVTRPINKTELLLRVRALLASARRADGDRPGAELLRPRAGGRGCEGEKRLRPPAPPWEWFTHHSVW